MDIPEETIQQHIPQYLSQETRALLNNELDKFRNKNMDYLLNDFHHDGSSFLQGDGWSHLEVVHLETKKSKFINGVLLSNSCDMSQENDRHFPPTINFAPLISVTDFQTILSNKGIEKERISSILTSIREQRATSYFYIPKEKPLTDGQIVFLSDIHTVSVDRFEKKTDKKRLFTLSQAGFWLFLLKLSIHFCRFNENVIRQ